MRSNQSSNQSSNPNPRSIHAETPNFGEKSAKNEPKQAKTVQNEREWMRKRSATLPTLSTAPTRHRSRQTWAQNVKDDLLHNSARQIFDWQRDARERRRF
ncbi:hypothetical protein L596_012083 [Steinernema carpocapsae]|uniref:Uncharacterized protein n=1 Tax=Steinernema carpocapsae TaxID=34508 RepID=A0A4U5NWM7_STECR|nr:hypothetical protein L596_012083 [Steinernema carpocapsae]